MPLATSTICSTTHLRSPATPSSKLLPDNAGGTQSVSFPEFSNPVASTPWPAEVEPLQGETRCLNHRNACLESDGESLLRDHSWHRSRNTGLNAMGYDKLSERGTIVRLFHHDVTLIPEDSVQDMQRGNQEVGLWSAVRALRKTERDSGLRHPDGQTPGGLNEPAVEGENCLAMGSCAEVKCIGEVHPGFSSGKGLGQKNGALNRNTRKPQEGAQSRRNPFAVETVDTAQHPLAFEQDGRAHKDVSLTNRRSRSGGLVGIVSGQVSDNDIGINRAHVDAVLLPEYPPPCRRGIWGRHYLPGTRRHPLVGSPQMRARA